MADDPYAVLGVDPSTDIAQIRRAYLAQLRRHHPDVRPGDQAAEQRTRELNRAWDQVRRRRANAAAVAARPAPSRDTQPAYSSDRRTFRLAFTSATLRVAFAVLAVGLVLLAAQLA